MVGLLGCQGYSSYEYLDGKFINQGSQLAPTLLSPANNSAASTATQFVWTTAADARSYRIEFSTNANISSPILKATTKAAPYMINNSDLIGIGSLPEQVYYWRVVTIFPTKEESSPILKFTLFDKEIIYVDKNSMVSTEFGTNLSPFKTIQPAINFAVLNGRTKVFVSKGTYSEFIALGNDVGLYGGYDAAAGWTRNVNGNVTTLTQSAANATITATNLTGANTSVDGFTILHTAVSGTLSMGIYALASKLTISNNNINAGGADTSYGVRAASASEMLIQNNLIGSNSGIYRYSIELANSSGTVSGNRMAESTGSSGNYGIHVISSNPVILNNLIYVENTSSYGVYCSQSSPTILNNSIIVGSGGSAIYLFNGSNPIIRNNILGGIAGSIKMLHEELSGNNPAVFQNNNLFGSTNLYLDWPGNVNITGATFASTAVSTGSGTFTLAAMGNVNIDNAGNQLFADINGADNVHGTISDNNWHLTTNAAICNIRGGGLDLSGSFTTDNDGLTRTISVIAGCTPTNTGATNWSIGAYESN